MSFVRVRTIKGRKYRYLETRYREGGKVRSKSVYLGAGEIFSPVGIADHGVGQWNMEKDASTKSAGAVVTPSSAPSSTAPSQPGEQSPSDAPGKAS